MDKGQAKKQILSYGPLLDDPPLHICQTANIELAKAITIHSDRFAGLAFHPMNSPLDATAKLARCVTDLGFTGTLIPNHLDGRFYDSEKFWSLFEKAQELDVPIYVHPTCASDDMTARYTEILAKRLLSHSATGEGAGIPRRACTSSNCSRVVCSIGSLG